MEFLKNFVMAALVFGLCYAAWQNQCNRTPTTASVSREEAVPAPTNSAASAQVSSTAPAPPAPPVPAAAPVPPPPVKIEMPKPNSNGFARLIWTTNLDPNSVVIVAPLNCPSLSSRKADALAQQLIKLGIPTVRTDTYRYDSPFVLMKFERTDSEIAASNAKIDAEFKVMGETLKIASRPEIFIRGNMVMMQANPSVSQVVAEYRSKTDPKSSASK